MRRTLLPLLGALTLTLATAALAAGPVASTEVPVGFLDGAFYWTTGVDGGSSLDTDLCGASDLVRVKLVLEDRFLAVVTDEDANLRDPSLSGVLARFPYERAGDRVRVRWGDDPTPQVVRVSLDTPRGRATVSYVAEGPADVYEAALDEAAGVITFVKKVPMACKETGGRGVWNLRSSLLKERSSAFVPKAYQDEAEFRRFGFFTTSPTLLADEDTGLVAGKELLCRIDISKPFVFELHPGVPEPCRKPVRDAVEDWNDVFERTCGVRPLRCVDGQADHLPGDLRWHVLYFRMVGTQPDAYSAYGPSLAIARTGEIVDADVVVDGTALMGELKKQLRFDEEAKREAEAAASEAAPKASGTRPGTDEDLLPVGRALRARAPVTTMVAGALELPMAGVQPDRFGTLGAEDSLVAAAGGATTRSKLPAEQRFYYLVRGLMVHELGHNLGLRHNFAASADQANFGKDQRASSIMDYLEHDERFYLPGPYDEAAIAFAYGGKAAGGRAFLFETDDDVGDAPLANRHDAGDPLGFYQSRVEAFVKKVRGHAKPTVTPRLLQQILDRNLGPVAKFINGINDERSEKAFDYLYLLLTYQFPADSVYRAKAHLSRQRLVAGWYLLDLEGITGRAPTRRQRLLVAEAVGAAIADRDSMLEPERLKLIERLALVQHVSTRKALQEARAELAARVQDASLGERDAEVEENVLMHVERALKDFLGAGE